MKSLFRWLHFGSTDLYNIPMILCRMIKNTCMTEIFQRIIIWNKTTRREIHWKSNHVHARRRNFYVLSYTRIFSQSHCLHTHTEYKFWRATVFHEIDERVPLTPSILFMTVTAASLLSHRNMFLVWHSMMNQNLKMSFGLRN